MKVSLIQNQSGNVLFMILIAIVLFGALSFTVANMMNSGNTNYVGEEKAKLYASEIIDYNRKLKQAVQNLRISEGCDATEISFANSTNAFFDHSSGPRDACKIFSASGGDMTYIPLNTSALDSSFSGNANYTVPYFTGGVRVLEIGTSNTELLGAALFLKQTVCQSINEELGLGSTIPIDDAALTYFTGAYTASATPDLADEAASLEGEMSFCAQVGDGSPYYAYFSVLLPR